MRYFIFPNNRDFEQGSLEDHLTYLRKYDGTPDFWDSEDDLLEALKAAKNFAKSFGVKVVVTDEYYEVQETYTASHFKVIKNVIYDHCPETHSVDVQYYDEAGGFEIAIHRSKNSRHGGLLIAGEGTKEISMLDICNHRTVWSGEHKSLTEYKAAVAKMMHEYLY